MTPRSLTGLSRDLRSGRISSRELLVHYLSRVETYNPRLGAITQLRTEAAHADASAIDAARQKGEPLGPLAGIPCTIKETFHVAGMRTTAGAKHLVNNHVEVDAPAVSRLRSAGAVIFGKSNVPAMTADWQTYNEIFGTTVNPWNPAKTAGGSSGGSAAAVATDLTAFDLGSDLCGCLRIPAHFCGVFAHRPSYGLTSVRGHVPGDPAGRIEPDLSVAGPLARNAADLRLLMRVLTDPWVELPRMPDFSDRDPAGANGATQQLRILAWLETPAHRIDSELREHFGGALSRFEALPGVRIDYGSPAEFSMDEIIDLCIRLTGRLMSTATSVIGRTLCALTALGLKVAGPPSSASGNIADYAWAIARGEAASTALDARRQDCANRVQAFFERYDLILTPVAPVSAFPHDTSPINRRRLFVDGQRIPYNELLVWNALPTVIGLPATIIPLGLGTSGSVIGLQVIAPRFYDDFALDFAERVESCLAPQPFPLEYAA